MGVRAHAVTKYVCEYGSSAFNYGADELSNMLVDEEVDFWQQDEFDNYSDWNVTGIEKLKELVEKLKRLPPDETNEYFDENEDNHYVTNAYVVDIFEEWLKCVDTELDVIRVHWF